VKSIILGIHIFVFFLPKKLIRSKSFERFGREMLQTQCVLAHIRKCMLSDTHAREQVHIKEDYC